MRSAAEIETAAVDRQGCHCGEPRPSCLSFLYSTLSRCLARERRADPETNVPGVNLSLWLRRRGLCVARQGSSQGSCQSRARMTRAVPGHADRPSRGAGQVDHAPARKMAPVVDADDHGPSVLRIGDEHPGPEGPSSVCRRISSRVECLTTRGPVAMEPWSVPGCEPAAVSAITRVSLCARPSQAGGQEERGHNKDLLIHSNVFLLSFRSAAHHRATLRPEYVTNYHKYSEE